MELQPLRSRCFLHLLNDALGIRAARVYQQGDHSSPRNQLSQQLKPLSRHLSGEHDDAREVAARPGEAGGAPRPPPGRARLAPSPSPTGSAPPLKTIGIVEVALFAASAAGGLFATIKSTLRPTRSAANAGSRS